MSFRVLQMNTDHEAVRVNPRALNCSTAAHQRGDDRGMR
jgi:hypothetical protein